MCQHTCPVTASLSDSAYELKRREDLAARKPDLRHGIEGGFKWRDWRAPCWKCAAAAISVRAAAASAAAAAHSMSGKRTRSNRDSATGVSALGKDVTGMAVVDSAMLRRAVTSLVAGHFALPDGKLLVAKVFLGNFGECGNSGRERSRSTTEGNGDGGSSNDDEHNDSETAQVRIALQTVKIAALTQTKIVETGAGTATCVHGISQT